MQARVKWIEGLTFIGESASGHQVIMDGNSGDKSPSPMEMLLMAIGTCSAADVVALLQQAHHHVTGCEVKLASQRQAESPRLFTHINLHFTLIGDRLTESLVCGPIEHALNTHCSALLMIGKTVKVTHSYDIVSRP